jgi:Tfp pilus assembly protein PilF
VLGRAAIGVCAAIAALLAAPLAGAQVVPPRAELAPAARAALQSAALTDAERAALRLRHGTWDDADLATPAQRARAALALWRLDDPALADPAAPAALRAAAATRGGAPERALELLGDATDATGLLERALALEALGRAAEAAVSARGAVEAARAARAGVPAGEDAEAAVRAARLAAVEATALLARVEGAPARDWTRMLEELAALREADRLDPAPRLAEGRLLVGKDRFEEGVRALREALTLDIRSSEAWYLLGRVALQTYDFDGARAAAAELRRLNGAHPLAALLEAETALQSRAPEDAAVALEALLEAHPAQRDALALQAAADAMMFRAAAAAERLAALERLAPGSPGGHYQVGRFLALLRQYDEAAAELSEAARRAPAWSAPVAELGLLEMQSGRDERALAALRRAVELDPFDERARFSLRLMEMLAGWTRFEGAHFIVRCRPGEDEVVAAMMPAALDAMHAEVCAWLGHEPAQRTMIELHPDHRSFAVRITGMPWIHTIAASTGPVIALEAPREGAPEKHLGRFDWLEVLRHEYVHTVTLDQTRNRIPHWFTEAIAVRLETKPRTFETAQLLAGAWTEGALFDLETINWAFVRPRRPSDRQLAYAQGCWMVEFIEARFGRERILALLAAYRDGETERAAFQRILGVDREEFMRQFRAWAGEELRAWGMLPEPSMAQIVEGLRAERGAEGGVLSIDDATLETLLARHPAHPDLLELWLRRRVKDGNEPSEEVFARMAAYSAARPLDTWPRRVLARHALDVGDDAGAAEQLRVLSAVEDTNPVYALELARIERRLGNVAAALAQAGRAARIDPYDARTRELAAAIAIEAGDLGTARAHVAALVRLEPTVPKHAQRLERVEQLLRERDDASGARGTEPASGGERPR